jgi:hypothetical protein
VIGIPEAAAGGDGLHPIEIQAGFAGGASGSLECVPGSNGIDVADGTNAAIASEDLVAEVAGVGSKTPLVNTVVGAEGTAASGEDFEFAPAAEWEVVGA